MRFCERLDLILIFFRCIILFNIAPRSVNASVSFYECVMLSCLLIVILIYIVLTLSVILNNCCEILMSQYNNYKYVYIFSLNHLIYTNCILSL